jgi:CRISPR system Cascade subunit CasA
MEARLPFNLIVDPWLPVRRLSGIKAWIAPAHITSDFSADPILALDFPRPDWNAAVTELLIGMLATVMAPEDTRDWADLWAEPPTPDELEERLGKIAFAFDLDGDGPRCFQDLALQDENWAERPIEWLVLAGPVENTTKLNTDLFSKRDRIATLCLPFAAASLVTQQTYAPEGGPGFRTSLRGGGPLTTLAYPRRKLPNSNVGTTLWDLAWSNTPDASSCNAEELADLPNLDDLWKKVFPWLAPTRTSENDKPTTLDHAHKLQMFFGVPCRIRLKIDETQSSPACSLDGPTAFGLVSAWWTRKHGVKYEGFSHPLSPYNVGARGQKTAAHNRPGIGTYRDWLKWAENPELQKSERANCLEEWGGRLKRIGAYAACPDGAEFRSAEVWQSGISACGYDFKQNKARAWLEARIPYFDPPHEVNADAWAASFRTRAANLVAGADEAAKSLRSQIRVAQTGKLNREGRYRSSETLPKDAYADLVERFWRETETAFRDALGHLREKPGDDEKSIRETFLKVLRTRALELFDDIAGTDNLADQDPRRIVEARTSLQYAFNQTGSVRKALDIMTEEARQMAGKRRIAKKKDAT